MSTRRRWWAILASWQRGKQLLIMALGEISLLGMFQLSPQFKVRCHLAKLPNPIHRRREAGTRSELSLVRERHRRAVERVIEVLARLSHGGASL